jgi:hypothetical protein
VTDNIPQKFARLSQISEAMRLIASVSEVPSGRLRVASGPTRGVLTFDSGYITSAQASGLSGVAALEKILRLQQAVFEFDSSKDSDNDADKVWVDVQSLLENSLSLQATPEDVNITSEVPSLNLKKAQEEQPYVDNNDYLNPPENPDDVNITTAVPAMLCAEPGEPALFSMSDFAEEKIDPNATVEIELYKKQVAKETPAVPQEPIADVDPDSGLTTEQRELLNLVSQLTDSDSFEQTAVELEENPDDGMLPEQKLALLESVEIDRGPFEQAEMRQVLNDTSALNEEQKELLDLSAKLADPESFNKADAHIDDGEEGPIISDAERWIILQNKELLTEEEAKAEFERDDKELARSRAQNIEFKPFIEADRLSAVPPDSEFEDLDSIPTPQVLPSDHDPIMPPPPTADTQKKGDKGLIGRMGRAWDKIPGYTRTVRKQILRPERIAGPIIFVALTLAIFIMPGYLKKMFSANQSEVVGAQQVNMTVADELDQQVPDALNDPEVAGPAAVEQGSTSGGRGAATGSGAPGGSGDAGDPEGALVQARSLVSRGWTKRAVALYHTYLALNPRSMAVRIELIKALMASKDKSARIQARIECLEALKLKPSFEQTQEIGALFQQVQLD